MKPPVWTMEAAAPLSAALAPSTTTQIARTIQRRRAMKKPKRANASWVISGGAEDIGENQYQHRNHDDERGGAKNHREQDARSVCSCTQIHLADLAGRIPAVLRRMHLYLTCPPARGMRPRTSPSATLPWDELHRHAGFGTER